MADYFCHDYNARNDPKLIKLQIDLGQEGKGIFWDIIEMLYEQNGKLKISEINVIAFAVRSELSKVKKVIYDYGLFKLNEDNGYFYFTYVHQSNYIIKVFPDENSQYVPTYYGNTLKWNDATIIYLNDSIYDLDIHIINTISSSGPGSISGALTLNGSMKPYTEILLLNLNGNPVDYIFTDINGSFIFTDLAYGTYILYAEETGKYNIPVTVTINENNPVISNIELTLYNSSTGNSEYLSNISISNIFPNPVLYEINFKLDVPSASDLFLSVFNAFGQKVKESQISLNDGQHIIKLSADDLPSGFYLLNIVSDNGKINENKRFVK